MQRILVTGSAGLLGSAITKKLRAEEYQVIDCDIRFIDNHVNFYSETAKSLMQECDGIIHLAAISRVIHGEQYPELCNKVNVEGTEKFLTFYANLPQKPWLIYGSSREVYGQQKNMPVKEDATFNPVNVYARGKVEIENKVRDLSNEGFNTAILRFSNVYGGLMDHFDRVMPAFCISALKNENIRIDGKECIFDFTYVDDVVDGIILTVEKLQESQLNTPIHFTGCRGCDLEELAEMIKEITNSSSKLEYMPPRGFDVARFYGDYTNAKEILGWAPKYTLDSGIRKFIQDLKNAKKNAPNNLEMTIYENIKSYSWLPSLL